MQTNSLKLDKAYKLVTTHWFPYEVSVLNEIENKLQSSEIDKNDLVSLLRKDISIFLICLKELVEITSSKKVSAWDTEVTCFIEAATIDQIKQCIKKVREKPVSHFVRTSTAVQKQRLSEMVVSSQAADSLSKESESLNEVAFSCSLIRQLGYTLIAWNYPRIFEAVTSKAHTKESLDAEFVATLGFSPIMLACTVLEKWGFPKQYLKAAQDRGSVKVSKSINPVVESKKDLFSRVGNICAVGEALARATNPNLFKSADEDMELASGFIESFLGQEGVEKVISSAREKLSGFPLEIPSLLASNSKEELDKKIKLRLKGTGLLNANPYVDSLPSEMRELVRDLYQEVIPKGPSYSSVSAFAKEVFPRSAFAALQVYLFDPYTRRLYPSLVLGKASSIVPKPVYLKTASGIYGMLAEALKTKSPLKEDSNLDGNDDLTVVACSLGGVNVVGVLYVEMLKSDFAVLSRELEIEPLRYFKALKILLSDCLGLD